MNPVLEALFGNLTATCALLFVQSYGKGHAKSIANRFHFGLNMTQRQLKSLEEQGGSGQPFDRQSEVVQPQ